MARISTAGMSREEWLRQRRQSIGGSDAAAIVGLSAYASPYSVWADKLGLVPEKEDTEAMRLGRDLEEYVAKRFTEETGKKVKRYPYIIRNENYPFAHANIDRVLVGEKAGLECKTTSTLDVKQFRGVEFPEKYYAQCVHYLAVTGLQRWYLAVLVFGRGFFTYCLERDEAEIEALMTAERLFWKNVEEKTPPLADGSEATSETLRTLYADSSDGKRVELFGREKMLDEYMTLKREKKALDERLKAIQNDLCAGMEDAESAVCGAYSVSWKTQERKTFDADAFRAAYPDVDLTPFYKTTASRPFKVKEQTGDS